MGAARVSDPSTAPRAGSAGPRMRWPAGLLAASATSVAVAALIAMGSGVEDRGAVVTEFAAGAGNSAPVDHLVGTELFAAAEDRQDDGPLMVGADRLEGQLAEAEPIPVEPVQVSIPALGIETSVITVGLDAHRAVEVPEDINIVGWYEHAAFPGSDVGSAVLVGHRDGSGGRKGVFYSVGNLERGDRVEVAVETGETVVYEVVSRELIDNVDFDSNAARLFAVDGDPVLTLISCGGLYDRNRGGYQSNIVVTANPTSVGG